MTYRTQMAGFPTVVTGNLVLRCIWKSDTTEMTKLMADVTLYFLHVSEENRFNSVEAFAHLSIVIDT